MPRRTADSCALRSAAASSQLRQHFACAWYTRNCMLARSIHKRSLYSLHALHPSERLRLKRWPRLRLSVVRTWRPPRN